MTREQYNKAESIIQKIRQLENTKYLINTYPAECYSIRLGLHGSEQNIANVDCISIDDVEGLVALTIGFIDIELKKMDKKLEEI